MNSSTPNAEPHTPEEEISRSIEENSEPDETSDPQTPGDESEFTGEGNPDAEDISSNEEDSDDETETTTAVARRFARSRAPSPDDPSHPNGYGHGVDQRVHSAAYVSPPQSAIATGARLAPSPSPHDVDIPPRDPPADADGPPCDSTPDTGSDSGRTDG